MADLMKFIDGLLEELPEVKKQIEEDDKWIDERTKVYITKGIEEEKAIMMAWDDYWKMAHERDGVEFSIHKLT